VPRYSKDGMRLTWPAKNPPRDQLEANAARLRAALE
jgi:histidine triad (HIT) family protein